MSNVNPRPMYFSQIRVDPTNDLRVYVGGVQLHISDDGGKTFIENGTLHSDHHALWINPANPNHIIDGNDGGIGMSWDKGKIVGGHLQHEPRAVLPRRLRHGGPLQPVRRHAGQLHVVRPERGPQQRRHPQRRLVSHPGRRRLRGARRSERPQHRLCRVAERQHGARRSPDQGAHDDPAAAGTRRAGQPLELEYADGDLAAQFVDDLCGRRKTVSVHRSRPELDGDQRRPDAASRIATRCR